MRAGMRLGINELVIPSRVREERNLFRASKKGIGSYKFAKDFWKGAPPWDFWNALAR